MGILLNALIRAPYFYLNWLIWNINYDAGLSVMLQSILPLCCSLVKKKYYVDYMGGTSRSFGSTGHCAH